MNESKESVIDCIWCLTKWKSSINKTGFLVLNWLFQAMIYAYCMTKFNWTFNVIHVYSEMHTHTHHQTKRLTQQKHIENVVLDGVALLWQFSITENKKKYNKSVHILFSSDTLTYWYTHTWTDWSAPVTLTHSYTCIWCKCRYIYVHIEDICLPTSYKRFKWNCDSRTQIKNPPK